jgi:hypothetical protein
MPDKAKRVQVTIRLDAEANERAEQLRKAISRGVGQKVTLSEVFRLGLVALEREYGLREKL